MKKKQTTFGVPSEQLSKLFKIGSDIEQDIDIWEENGQILDLLQDILMQPLPFESLSDTQKTIASLIEQPLRHLLFNPDTDLASIKRIKAYGRHLVRSSESKHQKSVGTVIYYAAIAHALVHHKTKITKHTDSDLAGYFEKIHLESWVPLEICGLCQEAQEVCKGEIDK